MSIEIKQPFGIDTNGSIAFITDPNEQTNQHLLALVSVQPGQRVMMPTYGVPSFSYLFGINDEEAQDAFLTDVKNAVATWESAVNVVDVAFNQIPDDFNAQWDVDIDWVPGTAILGASSGVMTATVLVGGTVVEDTDAVNQ